MAVEESLDKIIDYRNLHDMVRATVERSGQSGLPLDFK